MRRYIDNLKVTGVRQVLVEQNRIEEFWLRHVLIYIEDGVILSRQAYSPVPSITSPVVCTHLNYRGDNEQIKAFLNPDNGLTYLETEYNEWQVEAAKLLLSAINDSFGAMTPRSPTLDKILSRIVSGLIYEAGGFDWVDISNIKAIKKQLANITDSNDFISKADIINQTREYDEKPHRFFELLPRAIPQSLLIYKDDSGRWKMEDHPRPRELSLFSNLTEVLDFVGNCKTPVYFIEYTVCGENCEGVENFKVRRVTK